MALGSSYVLTGPYRRSFTSPYLTAEGFNLFLWWSSTLTLLKDSFGASVSISGNSRAPALTTCKACSRVFHPPSSF